MGESVQVRLGGEAQSSQDAEFATSGKIISFPGFLRAYVEGSDDPEAELADQEKILPTVSEGQRINCNELDPKVHTTQPPARFSEAALRFTFHAPKNA